MRNRTLKAAALVAMMGMVFGGFGFGCLGGKVGNMLWQAAATSAVDHTLDSLVLDSMFLVQDAGNTLDLANAMREICEDDPDRNGC